MQASHRASDRIHYGAILKSSAVALLFLLLAGCGNEQSAPAEVAAPQPVAHAEQDSAAIPCEEVANIRPVCGFTNPEDLAVVPGGEQLIVSEMAAFMSNQPGELSLLNVTTEERAPLSIEWNEPEHRWGDAACSAPDVARFSPHGIDLITRRDGAHQLLVINHGDEQVEFFELTDASGDWGLQWRGCAKPPADAFINDVAALSDGGFFVTHMWNQSLPFDEVARRLTTGVNTGWVWEWQAASGFTKVPNTDELMPNGIAVNAANTKLFVNIYFGNRNIRIDRASGEIDGEVSVRSPDNVVVDGQGNLWIASHLNDPIEGRCAEGHPGPCLLPFQVVKVNAETMESEVVLDHDGEPMGYTTVALPHRGRVYMGTASGDRLASAPL